MQQFDQAPVPADVPDRVTALEGKIGTVPSGTTLQGEIDTNTEDIANVKDNLGLENAIADCDSQIVRIAVTNGKTLNTPYKAGLTNFVNGCSIIGDINTSVNYIHQIYMSNGETRIFIRRKYNGAWQSWQELALKSELFNTIASGTDLDTITTPGYYTTSNADTLTNAPVSGANRLGLLVQKSENGYVFQMATENLLNTYGVFTRRCINWTWTSWERLALKSETEIVYGTVSATGITFQSNDTYLVKIGHLVIMQLAFKPDADVSAWTTFFTIPEGFRPVKTVYAADLYNYNADRHYEIYKTTGEVQASFKMDASAQRRTSSIVWYV